MTAIIFFSLFFMMLLLTPVFFRVSLAFWGSIFQIYTVPVLGFYPSLALISHFSLTPALLSFRRTLQQPTMILLIGILTLQTISLIWSPNKHLGLATILYELPFLILYMATFHIATNTPTKLALLIKCYAVLSLAPLLVLIVFRLHFNLDADFLQTSLAKILINPNTLKHSLYAGNHIELSNLITKLIHADLIPGRWLDKPHSFFMNPNTCAGYLGICSFLFWGTGMYYQSRLLKIIAILDWMGSFLILSFSAMVFAIAIPAILILIYYKSENKFAFSRSIQLTFLSLISVALLALYFNPSLKNIISHKLDARIVLWKAAASFIPRHIFTGLGFGGWATYYESYRQLHLNPLLQPNYPPHNTFIQLFFDSGILVIVLCLLFMATVFAQCKLAYQQLNSYHEKVFALSVIGAFLWVFLQGMGENWGFLGEMHIQAILAVSFATLMSLYYSKVNNNA